MRTTIPKLYQSLKVQTTSLGKNIAQSTDELSAASNDTWALSHITYSPSVTLSNRYNTRRLTWNNNIHTTSNSINKSVTSSLHSSNNSMINSGMSTPARCIHSSTAANASIQSTNDIQYKSPVQVRRFTMPHTIKPTVQQSVSISDNTSTGNDITSDMLLNNRLSSLQNDMNMVINSYNAAWYPTA